MYETVAQMAERLNVNKRTVQMWANTGKIPGAVKQGKVWLMPRDSAVVSDEVVPVAEEANVHVRTPMPLMNLSYFPGHCLEAINAMGDEESKRFAMAEYYYALGEPVKVCEIVDEYEEMYGYTFRPAASLLYAFANIGMGHIQYAKMGLLSIKNEIENTRDEINPQERAMQVYIDTMANAVLHLPKTENALEDYIHLLPTGMRIHACYALAYEAYLRNEYEKAIGMAEIAILVHKGAYPYALIDVHIIAAMCYMALKKMREAEKHLKKAWELAYPDKFFQTFGEHHSRLCGLIEKCIKNDYPEEYEIIIKIANRHTTGWRRLKEKGDERELPQQLTPMELCVATLACRNWSNSEIAEHMHLSVHTVKYYLSVVYQKIGVSTRKELKDYMDI